MKKKLKELNGVVNDLLELDYHITDMKNLLYDMLASAKTINFELDLLTGKMTPKKTDDLGIMYGEKQKWFISRIKELGIFEEISSAKLTLIDGKETIFIKTKEGRIFGNKVKTH
jgi:hypothetical protein